MQWSWMAGSSSGSFLKGFWSIGTLAVLLLAFTHQSIADPTGDSYSVGLTNLGNDDGPHNVTFDETLKALGTSGLSINESAIPYPGNALFEGTDFLLPGGEAIELSLTAASPLATLVPAPDMPTTTIAATDIDLLSSQGKMIPAIPKNDNGDEHGAPAFLYFTVDGVPQMMNTGSAPQLFGPHPWNPGVAQVLFVGPPLTVATLLSLQDGKVGITLNTGTIIPGVPFTFSQLLEILGLTAAGVNGMHLGVLVDRDLEPLTACTELEATITGTAGDDHLVGTSGDDVIKGLGGNDTIYGFGGNDVLCGGAGSDMLFGGPGNDLLYGGQDNDLLFGGDGDDELDGGPGADVLEGASGNDILQGGNNEDILRGGSGIDILWGGNGSDVLTSGPENGELHGDAGHDVLLGGNGDDTLDGGHNVDICIGGSGVSDTAVACEVERTIP